MDFGSITSLFILMLLIVVGIKITGKVLKFIAFVGAVLVGVVFLMSTGIV